MNILPTKTTMMEAHANNGQTKRVTRNQMRLIKNNLQQRIMTRKRNGKWNFGFLSFINLKYVNGFTMFSYAKLDWRKWLRNLFSRSLKSWNDVTIIPTLAILYSTGRKIAIENLSLLYISVHWGDLIKVNRGNWLGSPANIKGANKDAKIDVGRSATLHNLLFSLIHYAWIT